MKKGILILFFAMTVVLYNHSFALAEEPQEMGNNSQQRGQGMGGQGKGGGMGMMGGMMQKDSMVATSDGGVVVLAGPRLLKYDKDLTLVKEVELPRGKKPGQGQSSEGQPQPDRGMPSQEDQLPTN